MTHLDLFEKNEREVDEGALMKLARSPNDMTPEGACRCQVPEGGREQSCGFYCYAKNGSLGHDVPTIPFYGLGDLALGRFPVRTKML